MRSRSGGGTRSSRLAVAMKNTADRSNGDVQIVIAELRVLLRIEHLEQRRGRIAAEICAELVDLVEHEDRIARARLLQPLQDAARQRADVGAAMAADLRLVAHAAERDAHELAPHRARDRAAERGLADARRPRRSTGSGPRESWRSLRTPRNSRMRSLMPSRCAWSSSRICFARCEIEAVGRQLRPGQLAHPLEVAAHHLGLGAVGVHALEAPQLASSPRRSASGVSPASSSFCAILRRLLRGADPLRRAPSGSRAAARADSARAGRATSLPWPATGSPPASR